MGSKKNLDFLIDEEDLDHNFDKGYIGDIDDILNDIRAIHIVGVCEDIPTHNGEPRSTELESNNFEQLVKDA